jgi:DNA-dependent metalloprotease WSS1
LLRLRYAGDARQFLPLEQVVDTMLHELSHNVFGPHDDKFHALWNQLREEYEGLLRKGYTGEGFLSEGRKLGGQRIPTHEARRIARNAAEKRRNLSVGSGQRLGGAPVRPGADIRDVIVSAIERRATITKGCASDSKDEKEIKAITDQAMKNGFRTKAEEDEANEQAIAQALWELVQEDEREKYGGSYIPPSAANPTGNGGGMGPTTQPSSRPPLTAAPSSSKWPTYSRPESSRPISRLVYEQSPSARSSTSTLNNSPPPPTKSSQKSWECPVCTCHNSITYLSCDACTTGRPSDAIFFDDQPPTRTSSAPKPKPAAAPAKSKTWTCHMCYTVMEDKWWTCSSCATMKLSS